jgi:hypothetical protein
MVIRLSEGDIVEVRRLIPSELCNCQATCQKMSLLTLALSYYYYYILQHSPEGPERPSSGLFKNNVFGRLSEPLFRKGDDLEKLVSGGSGRSQF